MRSSILLLWAFLLLPLFTQADVNPKDGSYKITVTDHSNKALNGFELTRYYHSAADRKGLFGVGWGSNLETTVTRLGDGALLVTENGVGDKVYFESVSAQDKKQREKLLDQLVKAAVKAKRIKNKKDEKNQLRAELASNIEKRADLWLTLPLKTRQKFLSGDKSSRWISSTKPAQKIEQTAEGFKRSKSDGTYELFNESGQILGAYTRHAEPEFSISYKQGQPHSLTDKVGTTFTFTLNGEGLVTKVSSGRGESLYEYAPGNLLVKATNTSGQTYTYAYNQEKKLIAQAHEGQAEKVEYEPTSGRVAVLVDAEDEETKYVYKSAYKQPVSPNDSIFALYKIRANTYSGAPDSTYYEYGFRRKSNGERYTYRLTSVVNGITTQTLYNECGCAPISIERGYRKTNFSYDEDGHLIFKDSNTRTIKASYVKELGKISEFEAHDKETGETTVTRFAYNNKGDVTEIRRDDVWVKLDYNDRGLITSMKSNEGDLKFEYNQFRKPTKIEMVDLGTMVITYNELGEIENVESPEGHKIALKITSAFQNLLSLTKPDGLDYNM